MTDGKKQKEAEKKPKEIGERTASKGLEPTRYGYEWEKDGKCVDFS